MKRNGTEILDRATVPAVETAGLSVRYGSCGALNDVSVTIPGGGVTALIGPSGCGKTTFLNCLNRLTDLIPGCTVTGRVSVSGEMLSSAGLDTLALRRRVGMIFQQPNPLPMSIRRNFELPLREHGVRDRGELHARAEQALRDAGLWEEVSDRLGVFAPSLSGGQQQRLCIARAIALKPQILLMDEPCSALDPMASQVVETLIQRLGGRYTVIVVTHNLAQARRIADFTGVFWSDGGGGRLLEFGPTRHIFETPNHPITAAYIEGRRG